MSAWLINPPSSGTLAFSLRLAPSLPAADSPAFHTSSSASLSLAHSQFPGTSSATPPPYRLLRHSGFLTSPHALPACNKRSFTSLRLLLCYTDHPSVAWAHPFQLPTAPRPLLCTSTPSRYKSRESRYKSREARYKRGRQGTRAGRHGTREGSPGTLIRDQHHDQARTIHVPSRSCSLHSVECGITCGCQPGNMYLQSEATIFKTPVVSIRKLNRPNRIFATIRP